MSPAEVLRAAANVLRTKGWCQRTISDGQKSCAVGAILSIDEGDAGNAAWQAMIDHLGRSVPAWNDSPGRTADEVIATMEAVAEKLS